jgi:hypothetical protein
LLLFVERQVAVYGARFTEDYSPPYTADPAHYMYSSLCAIRTALKAPRPALDEVLHWYFRPLDGGLPTAVEPADPTFNKGR